MNNRRLRLVATLLPFSAFAAIAFVVLWFVVKPKWLMNLLKK